MATPSYAGSQPAPEFPPLEWLNVESPLSLARLKGKVVLLDFWTYGCINCIHVIPDLKRLEAEFPQELAVVGVHSAKFGHEGDRESIQQIISRYELEHPVANDKDFLVWRSYRVRAWPTTALIDPEGNYVGSRSGEGVYDALAPVIRSLVEEFDQRGLIDRRPLPTKLEESVVGGLLSFPGKLLADPSGERLFVSDSNHDRVVVVDLSSLELTAVFGGASPGFVDGPGRQARFFRPQGLAVHPNGRTLYVADTENHAIREIDLERATVRTLAGTGRQARDYPGRGGRALEVDLNSPWDLELVSGLLYVAMAGNHQLWRLHLGSGEIQPWVGSGGEGIDDGPPAQATLAQPSGLTSDGTWLYFADPESSAVRAALLENGRVRTIVGSGLFEFGDENGVGSSARLQHALGVVYRPADGLLYVADTYNSKLKTINPETGEARTFAGGARGFDDGGEAQFNEPGGLALAGEHLYVADTNNHAVRRVDLNSRYVETLDPSDPRRLGSLESQTRGGVVELPPVQLRAGEGRLQLHLSLPAGYDLSALSPLTVELAGSSLVRAAGGLKRRRLVHPALPVELATIFREGRETAEIEVDYSYCPEGPVGGDGLCRAESLRFRVPISVSEEGDSTLSLQQPD